MLSSVHTAYVASLALASHSIAELLPGFAVAAVQSQHNCINFVFTNFVCSQADTRDHCCCASDLLPGTGWSRVICSHQHAAMHFLDDCVVC